MVTVAAQVMGKQELRDEIIQAALKLVTEKGYFNTSIADICKQADVSTGTIYHYFKTKESIVDALFQEVLQNLSDSIEEITAKSNHTFERLRAIAELFFALTEEAPEVKPFQQLTWIMQEGIKAGDIRRMDPAVASACFYGTIVQMVQMRLDGALDRPLNWYLLDTWTAIWRMLSPP
jgi:AcrR family transcriptional regulator